MTTDDRLDRLERAIVVLIENANRLNKVHDAPNGPLDQITREVAALKTAEKATAAA
jgi:hypothetical protein